MSDAGSRGTSAGMRRYWRTKPVCRECKEKRPQNALVFPLCSKCRKRAGKELERILGSYEPVVVEAWLRVHYRSTNTAMWTLERMTIEKGVITREDGTTVAPDLIALRRTV